MKTISTNRKAFFDYFVEDTYEAGISLKGSEVKSLRAGNCNLQDGFIFIDKNMEIFVNNIYIKTYEMSTAYIPDERRGRKLLMHAHEIKKLHAKVQVKGYTLIPLELYFKGSNAKVKVGLCKGKHNYDKKEDLKQKDINRELERSLKDY